MPNSEGNPVHPLFASDEYSPNGEYCDDCDDVIVEPLEDNDGTDEWTEDDEADRAYDEWRERPDDEQE